MKKSILFIWTSMWLLSCEVGSNMGQITLVNTSDKEAKNIKIANTSILATLASGESYNYYFFNDFSGKPSADGFKFDDTAIIKYGENSLEELEYKEGMIVKPTYKLNEHSAILFEESGSEYIVASTGDIK